MRVLLISANRLKAPYPVFPLGLDVVAAAIAPRHELRIIDLLAEADSFPLEQAVTDFQPQAVGISLRNIDNTDVTRPLSFVEQYGKLVLRIRSATQAPIILGGSGFTIFADSLLRVLGADYGIAGRGDALAQLLDCIEQEVEPAGIPGLVVQGSGGAPPSEPWSSSPGPRLGEACAGTDVGALLADPPPAGQEANEEPGEAQPAPTRRRTAEYFAVPGPGSAQPSANAPDAGSLQTKHGSDPGGARQPAPPPSAASVRLVDTAFYIANGGMLNFQTKRGCPYRCSYCTYPRIEGHELSHIEPEEVARTARALERAGARYLFATDSTFNCSIPHNLAVADALRVAGLSIPWGAFFAPVRTPAEYYLRLAAAGLTHVEFGTESLSDVMLRSYRKPFCLDDVFREHDKALAAGLNVAHYFMLGGPGETPATLDETLANVYRLPKTVSFFFCGVRIYPGTMVHLRAVEEGLVAEHDDLLAPVYYSSPALRGVDIEARVQEASQGRVNWVIGSGGERTMKLLERMYARGHVGPLWEKLVR